MLIQQISIFDMPVQNFSKNTSTENNVALSSNAAKTYGVTSTTVSISNAAQPTKLQDFGEKIGGARKDLWKERGMRMSDLESLDGDELKAYVTKDNVWPKPDYRKMVENGRDKGMAFFVKYIRDAVPSKPVTTYQASTKDASEGYLEAVSELKKEVEAVTCESEMEAIWTFWERHNYINHAHYYSTPINAGRFVITSNLWKRTHVNYPRLVKKMKQSNFLVDRTTVQAKARKKRLALSPITNLVETGFDYRHGKHATEEDILAMDIRGGEFGNWEEQEERQRNMDCFYDSMNNLAVALNVPVTKLANPNAIQGHKALAIAFGARGRSNAMAHYEPVNHVINLTKMRGAGSLAHEFGHSIDRVMAWFNGDNSSLLCSDVPSAKMKQILDVLKYKELDAGETMRYFAKQVDEACQQMRKSLHDVTSRWLLKGADKAKVDTAIESCITEALSDDTYRFHLPNGRYNQARSAAFEKLEAVKPSGYYINPISVNMPREKIAMALYDYHKACSNPGSVKVTDKTDFYSNAIEMDKLYSKDSFGYWASSAELFARAFACYVEDKLAAKGIRDDYLTGHADGAAWLPTGWTTVGTNGNERKTIDKAFDKFFEHLKQKKYF